MQTSEPQSVAAGPKTPLPEGLANAVAARISTRHGSTHTLTWRASGPERAPAECCRSAFELLFATSGRRPRGGARTRRPTRSTRRMERRPSAIALSRRDLCEGVRGLWPACGAPSPAARWTPGDWSLADSLVRIGARGLATSDSLSPLRSRGRASAASGAREEAAARERPGGSRTHRSRPAQPRPGQLLNRALFQPRLFNRDYSAAPDSAGLALAKDCGCEAAGARPASPSSSPSPAASCAPLASATGAANSP